MSPRQLILGISLRDNVAFDNYYLGGNEEVVYNLKQCTTGKGEQFIYLWGQEGTGKSHLLQAMCKEVGDSAVYLPLSELQELVPEMLEGLESMDLVCIDDIDQITGKEAWELQVFALFNRMRESGHHLIISASKKPADLNMDLPDLLSRLTWGLSQHLKSLDDDQKLAALQLRADKRGFELPENVGRYLLKHSPRNLSALFDLLDHLDEASMAEQHKLTIPFVKKVTGFDT